ncbi:unnamed protein product [Protopolystoma xenopodis]|uniref:Uncharacterized protein n=1 Tax=Protopolystoma xenopodis TaxID=117903 RepID=A0A3S5B0M4_9PLAT|nr:unnamed protein product [Protopolystoma xenopodis]
MPEGAREAPSELFPPPAIDLSGDLVKPPEDSVEKPFARRIVAFASLHDDLIRSDSACCGLVCSLHIRMNIACLDPAKFRLESLRSRLNELISLFIFFGATL